jgi:hypothetical protein
MHIDRVWTIIFTALRSLVLVAFKEWIYSRIIPREIVSNNNHYCQTGRDCICDRDLLGIS